MTSRLIARSLAVIAFSVAASGCAPAAAPARTRSAAPPRAASASASAHPRAHTDAGLADRTAAADAAKAEAIADAINAHSVAIHRCWAKAAADDFHVEGKVVLAASIGSDGSTAAVRVVSDGPKDPVLTRCLVTLWKRQRWPAVFQGGETVQLPPFDFVAPDAQYSVRADDVAPVTLAGGNLVVKKLLTEKNTGNGAASMSLVDVGDGFVMKPRRESSTEILYVLSGGGIVYGRRGERHGTAVTSGSAVYIPPGVAHGFAERKDGHRTRLLALLAPAGADSLADRAGAPAGAVAKRPHRSRHRHGLKVTKVPAGKDIAGPGKRGHMTVLFDLRGPTDRSTFVGVATATPGPVPPPNSRRRSVFMYLLAGGGRLTIAGNTVAVGAGTAIQIPPGVTPALAVTGSRELRAIVFQPPRPERRAPADVKGDK